MTDRITSNNNPFIKHIRKLLSRRDYRRECGEFVVEGRRLYDDALRSGLRPQAVLLDESLEPEAFEAVCPSVTPLAHSLMASLSDTKTPQGVMALFPMPQAGPSEGEFPKQVLLCSLQDPGNVGAILRTAEAFGVSRVVLTADCPDLYSPKVLRASMGGVFRVPTAVAEDGLRGLDLLRVEGGRVYAAALAPDARLVTREDLSGRVGVVIGNEGNGLPRQVLDRCDGCLKIPMRGQAESLNAAMAAGILIWEMMKE